MTNQKFKIKNTKSLNPQEGEIVQTEDGKVMIYQNGEYKEIKVEGSNLELGLYELNKQVISQLPSLTDKELDKKIDTINICHEKCVNNFYMLYGKEISYFTLFKVDEPIHFAKTVLDCLNEIGEIKAIDPTEDGLAIEIWVQPTDKEPTCLYLFPYDNGLVVV